MKKLTGLAVAMAASIASTAMAEDKVVRMGTEGYYPPFNYFDASGNVVGFDIDIGNALCEEMQVKCEWVTTDWAGIIPALNSNKFDTIIASMSITAERAEVVSFSDPYYFNGSQFVVAGDGSLGSAMPSDLAGKVIGTQESTLEVKTLQAYFKDSEIRLYPKLDDALLDLDNGRLDAVYAGQVVLGEWLAKEDGACCQFVGEATRSDGNLGTGIAVRQEDTELLAALNGAIEAIMANGTYAEIRDRYFDFDIMEKPKTTSEMYN
ncbi:transporter substrate-binding domain-containing protein [Ruegeria atlantica]|uniref:transporter substrate-binding domain-containing protein n=1 Tax=Ruegeria atlantica TaxID=81569 RepID=UPI00147C3A41|nr:transporter substrate-binding domain-containing protein [Ruegeria atlantica]